MQASRWPSSFVLRKHDGVIGRQNRCWTRSGSNRARLCVNSNTEGRFHKKNCLSKQFFRQKCSRKKCDIVLFSCAFVPRWLTLAFFVSNFVVSLPPPRGPFVIYQYVRLDTINGISPKKDMGLGTKYTLEVGVYKVRRAWSRFEASPCYCCREHDRLAFSQRQSSSRLFSLNTCSSNEG